VYQIDSDGAALKTVNFAMTAQRLVGKSLAMGADGEVTYTTGDRQAVATMRSAGLGASRHGRAGQVAMAAADAALIHQAIGNAGGSPDLTLYAEDALRGYRVDILDSSHGRWLGLCDRQGEYAALPAQPGDADLPVDLPKDEGYVKGASTTSNPDKPDDHYLHETLFRWTGWSLAVARPGRTVRDRTEPGTGLQSEEVVDIDDTATNGNGLRVRFKPVKGALPRLRFGHEYRVRARLVDLAGNSLALDDRSVEELEHASEPVAYGRFEPVDPPVLALRRKVSEGESLERLVLRSNFDRTAAGYRADIAGALASLYDSPDFEYGDVAERHVVPPKTSQLMSELHGMFDDAIGSAVPAQAKAAYAIAARENGSLLHPVPGAQIELVTPAKTTAVATVQGPGEVIAPPEQADDSVDRFAAGQYVLHREPIVPVPYLPDPACGGLALHGVPGLAAMLAGKPIQLLAPGLPGVLLDQGLRAAQPPGSQTWVLLVDMDLDPGNDPGEQRRLEWPGDVRSLRLVLAEQPGEVDTPPCGDSHTVADPPQWNAAEGVLTLFLPKGHIARLRYASFVHDRLVDDFGLPRWHDAAGAERLGAQAMAGANWMVTPWRSLTLVHATQQPVCEPWLETVSVQRLPGSQHADLHARRVHLHGPSTGKFEIVAEWEEWIDDPLTDDPAAPGPRRVPHEAQLSEIRLDDNHPNVFVLDDAVRRQTEFTPVGGQVMPGELAQRPVAPGNRHEFGDTRFRFVRYRVRGTTRFREYLPPKLFADAALITRHGPVLQEHHVAVKSLPESDATHDAGAPVLRVAQAEAGSLAGTVVPASGPPQSPEVLFVVPTFRWERGASASGGLQSVRHGNGLRVYLDRPWFSSGDGELLGVVVPGDDAAFVTVEDALVPYVTQWGADPLWAGTQPSTRTRLADFPGRVANEPVNLIEVPGRMVQVVGHRVHFDAGRQLWYCDIELHPGVAYMPFVRLALVRYQPNAISGAEVSRVALAEFAQVLPRRRAVLKREGDTLSLSVHGPVPDRGPMRQFNTGGQAESEYADISFSPIPGAAQESGRNRMELVLQTRDKSIDSDLGWQDEALLSTGEVVAGATAPTPGGSLTSELLTRVEDAPVRVRSRGGRSLRFDRMVERSDSVSPIVRELGDVFDVRTPIEVLPGLPALFDLPVFLATATPPAVPEGREGRLMVREFERYYTDRTVPETRAGAVRRRIVVEERLVYAEVFALG
jgi:hypothetical protein